VYSYFLTLFLGGALLFASAAHTQNISGIINSYVHIVDLDTCYNTVTVASTSGFGPGDRVLIIQMKGATIDESNTQNYGSVTNSIYGQGMYEIATIKSIPDARTIRLINKIYNRYDVTGFVQLIKIPQFKNPIVTNTLTAQRWDPVSGTGGVLILEASDTLTLQAPIDVSGLGFRGGAASNNGSFPSITDFVFSPILGYGGYKGEGIAIVAANAEAGRGAPANGGGGGNSHNAGGGGGANINGGGRGGDQSDNPSFGRLANGGEPGRGVWSDVNKCVHLGGGGGGGHQNDGNGSAGGAGGGIVILSASAIKASAGIITANGESALASKRDGSGGGGGGGAILIITSPDSPSKIILEAKGGDGGDADAENASDAFGPGGGGGGGTICGANSVNFTTNNSGGSAGRVINCSNSAVNNSPYGAANGSSGAFPPISSIREGSIPFEYPSATPQSTTICANDTIIISASGGDRYNWTSSTTITDPSSASQTISPQSSTTYYVSITKGDCTFFDSVVVTVYPKPTVTITPTSTTLVSATDKIILNATKGFSLYQWSTNETTDSIIITSAGTYTITIADANGCTASSSITIQSLVQPEMELSLPIIQGYPGDHIILPVTIVSSHDVTVQSATDFIYTLRFNRSLLVPADNSIASRFFGRERTITAIGNRRITPSNESIAQVEFIAALGDTSETIIYFDSIRWSNGEPITTKVSNGLFKLLGICPQGGDRFYDPTGKLFLSTPTPNPVSGVTSIDYQLLEEGETELRVLDLLGRTISTVLHSYQLPGIYHALFDASALTNGLYTLILQTPSQVRISRMEVSH
jgi:hypothetical protein